MDASDRVREGGRSGLLAATVRWVARSNARGFWVLFLWAATLRVAVFQLLPEDLIAPNPDWETGAIALSLARSGAYADPYAVPTGPTAHAPPLYVGAASLLYRVLGTGYAGGLARWIVVLAASCVLWGLVPWMGDKTGLGREAGIVGGAAGTLSLGFPYEVQPFVALALLLLLAAFLARWTRWPPTQVGSILLGVASGAAFHLKPALASVVAGCLAYELVGRRRRGSPGQVSLVLLGIVVACVPWGWRNYAAFGEVFFIRSNFGLELYVGNHEGAHQDVDVSSARGTFVHPRTHRAEAEQVRDLGERVYMRRKGREALAWIRDHPGDYLRLTALRTLSYWAGPIGRTPTAWAGLVVTLLALLGAWRTLPAVRGDQRAALLLPLACYPLVYYAVSYMPRYAEPTRWILFLLAGAAVWGWVEGRPRRVAGSGA